MVSCSVGSAFSLHRRLDFTLPLRQVPSSARSLIFTVRGDPFIVNTSRIFAILGLRAIYFLLLTRSTSTRTRRAAEWPSHLKVIARRLLGFAPVLLSMFLFYVAPR